MIQGIQHIAMIVSSVETVAFYERLGFRSVFQKNRQNDTIILLEGFGIQLEMFVDPKHPPKAQKPENLGLRHVAFKVDHLENVMMDYDCSEIQEDWLGVRYVFTYDPDGMPVEFHE